MGGGTIGKRVASCVRLGMTAVLAAVLYGCGGGGGEAPAMPEPHSAALAREACDPQSVLRGDAAQVGGSCVRASAALRQSTADFRLNAAASTFTPTLLFNWAEQAFPNYFAPASQVDLLSGPYVYRYYPATGNYMGVAGGEVYVLGPMSGGALARVGTLSDFACSAALIGCTVPGAPTIVSVTAMDKSAIVAFTPPASSGSSPITEYKATCARGFTSIGTVTGSASPLTVTGLTNGQEYSCIVTAANSHGSSAPSAALRVTPEYPPSYQQTKIRLVSDSGDYIGGGRVYEYTKASTQITVTANGTKISVGVNGDQWWYGDFQLPSSQTSWQPGTYTGLTRYPFNSLANGGLDWGGEGRGCNTLTGSITVHSVHYTNNVLDAISFTFVQHCEGGSPALTGEITWGKNDPTKPPGPSAIPSSLWAPAAGSVPTSGNYIYLESDSGDYIGAGRNYLYTGSAFNVTSNGSLLEASVSSTYDWWSGDFQAMFGTNPLQIGYYPDLSRYPFHNPYKGGLSWSGNGRGCNELSGWFVIDDIEYQQTTLKRVSLRFEQHCEGGGSALRGQIKWTKP